MLCYAMLYYTILYYTRTHVVYRELVQETGDFDEAEHGYIYIYTHITVCIIL